MRARVVPACLGMAVLAGGPSASAQAPPAWGYVKVTARQPVRVQLERSHQAEIQGWFKDKIHRYQHVLDDTALATASPKIVDLGDWTAFYTRLLAPPGGRGTTTVTFGSRGAPSTLEGTGEIVFPQANADAYIDGNPNTCWHEFQHTIVMASEKAGRKVAIPRSPWNIYAKPSDNPEDYKVVEHVYMEGLAEYTTEWLDLLLHEKSALGEGLGFGFEKHARDAHEQMKAYRARNESLSYAVENFCWAKAHDAWRQAWEARGRHIAPVPLAFRQDYQQVCGVWIGFVEDVVRFYMEGGLKARDGSPIRVPEWVMHPDPMRTGVIVGHLAEAREIKGDTLRYGFDLRVLENYRRRERSESLNHGKVLVTLENPDADTSFELSVDGRPLRRSGASGRIDLAGFRKDGRIRVDLVRGRLSALAGTRRYKLLVEYQPDPRLEGGKSLPPFYYPSKAIYYLDVTGGKAGGAAASAAGKGAAPAGASQAAGTWRLKEVQKLQDRDQKMIDYRRNQFVSAEAVPGETEIALSESWKSWDEKARRDVVRTVQLKAAWAPPGASVGPKATVPVTLTLSGSPRLDASASLSAWFTGKGSTMGFGLWTQAATGSRETHGGSVSISDREPPPRSRTIPVPFPEATRAGDTVTLEVMAYLSVVTARVRYLYVWEQGEAPAAAAEARLSAEEPVPAPEPPGLDNVPPQPGDLLPLPKTTGSPPAGGGAPREPAGTWYAHPGGGYRLRLAKGWRIEPRRFFDEASGEYDTLWPADKGMAVVCARGSTEQGGRNGRSVLQAWADRLVRENPGAAVAFEPLGGAAGARVAAYDRQAKVMHWHLGLLHQGRSYYLSVTMPAASPPARLPEAVAEMLGSLAPQR